MLLPVVQHNTMPANEVQAYCATRPDARTSPGEQFEALQCKKDIIFILI